MAVRLEGGCRVSTPGDETSGGWAGIEVRRVFGRATGAEAISLRVLTFGPGKTAALEPVDCDDVLYVLDGTGQLLLDGRAVDVEPGSAVYVKAGTTLGADSVGTIRVASSQCPDPETPFRLAETPSEAEVAGPAPVVRLQDRQPEQTADRWYRVLLDQGVGSTEVTQFVGGIPPGRAPDHFHHYEEVLLVLAGRGRMWAGQTHTDIAAGSCIFLPRKQVHCVENTGDGELRLLGVFYPSGSPAVRYDPQGRL